MAGGLFDPTAVPDAWFDEQALPDGWFDAGSLEEATGDGGLDLAAGITLEDATLSATAESDIEGALSVTLGDATLAAVAELDLAAALGASLEPATLSATAAFDIEASVAVTLEDASLEAVAENDSPIVDPEPELPAGVATGGQPARPQRYRLKNPRASRRGDGPEPVDARVSVVLDDCRLVATALVLTRAALAIQLEDVKISAVARVDWDHVIAEDDRLLFPEVA